METKPRRRLGVLIFCLVFLATAGTIAATALFANNQRNLKRVLRSLGIPVTETMVIPRPGVMEKFKSKRLKGATLMLDAYIFMPEIRDRESAFLRLMRKDGKSLCDLFNRLGFPMSAWQPGGFTRTINECYNQLNLLNPSDPDNPSSFFLMIKGTPDGKLISTRVKIIFHDPSARARLAEMAEHVLVEFARATGWTEILDEKKKVLSLEPFTAELSGFTVKFSNEFSSRESFNLIMARSPHLTAEQKRTEDYFDRSRFLPLTPDYGGPPLPQESAKS
jgi:hypothetical protein